MRSFSTLVNLPLLFCPTVPAVVSRCNITVAYDHPPERLLFINTTWDSMPVSHTGTSCIHMSRLSQCWWYRKPRFETENDAIIFQPFSYIFDCDFVDENVVDEEQTSLDYQAAWLSHHFFADTWGAPWKMFSWRTTFGGTSLVMLQKKFCHSV